jgi:8-oxo-dGTP pyrophosphatase MutT (NUDIX family)
VIAGPRGLEPRLIYDSEWVRLSIERLPTGSGRSAEALHVIEIPRPAAGLVSIDRRGRTLMIRRYRGLTDEWGWEILAGRVESGESALQAAHRETLEETGWDTEDLQPLGNYSPMVGMARQRFFLFWGRAVVRTTIRDGQEEVAEVAWWPVSEVRARLLTGEVQGGLSITGLLLALQFGPLSTNLPISQTGSA